MGGVKKKKRFICALAAAAALTLCALAHGSPGTARRTETSAEEYAVYSAVIGEMFAGGKVTFDTKSKVRTLVIKDHTVSDSLRPLVTGDGQKYFTEQFPSIARETIDDFATKNKEAHRLRDAFELKLKHTFLKTVEFEEMFSGRSSSGSWPGYRSREA